MLSTTASALLMTMLLGTVVACHAYDAWRARHDPQRPAVTTEQLMHRVLATVLILFAVPKLLDLQGFTTLFSRYDWIAPRVPFYGSAYPFLELAGAAALLLARRRSARRALYVALLTVTLLSMGGVAHALSRGRPLRCACLGTLLPVPLSVVTFAEGAMVLIMVAMLLRSDAQKNVRFDAVTSTTVTFDVHAPARPLTTHVDAVTTASAS